MLFIADLVFYIAIVNLALVISLPTNSSSNFTESGSGSSGDQSGSGDYFSSGDDYNHTTCHCNETNLIASSCFLTKWLSPSKHSSGLHKLSSEVEHLKSLTDNKEVSVW